MNKHKQNGSLEIIGIVIIVLLLVGGIGFVAWNSFVKKDSSSNVMKETANSSPEEVAKKYKTVQIDESFPVKLSARYPENWAMSKTGSGPKVGEDSPVQQTITITSPSKDYTVSYMVAANGGFGGICLPEISGVINSIARDPVAGIDSALFVEAVIGDVRAPDGRKSYKYVSGLYQNDDTTKDVNAGDSLCKLGLINSVKLSDTFDTMLMSADVKINKFNKEQPDGSILSISDASLIKNAFGASEYKDAVQILKSIKLSK